MYSPKKFGVKYEPPTLVLFYVDKATDKLHRRSIPVRKFDGDSSIQNTANELKKSSHHGKFIEGIPQKQIEKLLKLIQDKIKGLEPKPTPTENKPAAQVDPDKNLNKLGDDELNKVKAAMDIDFEKNRIRPGDEDFEYDKEVDFGDAGKIESGWDEEDDYSDPDF
ncbi:centrosomal protein of 19 kDa [Nematostella vectensis]|uniref:centrosomal protein of 19 kDa n=1 Tax=Nematostella vectensis TaxID=45351 RepID=UPI0020776A2D|nr:centrosomal protein of 19 kDa [Nematostella vectensis]